MSPDLPRGTGKLIGGDLDVEICIEMNQKFKNCIECILDMHVHERLSLLTFRQFV
jgi:hypothetical protein